MYFLYKNISKQKGFTLVEMIVSIGIFTIVALVAVGALLKIIDANKKAHTLETSINNLNFALEAMSREMRVGSNYYCFAGTDLNDRLERIEYPDQSPTQVLPQALNCNISSSPWTVAFHSSKTALNGDIPCNLIYSYRFDDSTLFKEEQSSCDAGVDVAAPIISAKDSSSNNKFDSFITFDKATVRVVTSDSHPSYAQFHFVGSAGVKEKSKTLFDMQTTVSQRMRD